MGNITAATLLFVVLCFLEYLYWLSPLTASLNRLVRTMGKRFYFFPIHYLVRFAVLAALLLAASPPALWSPFDGDWLRSALLGGGMILFTYVLSRLLGFIQQPASFWQSAAEWLRENPVGFFGYLLYLLVYPGFGEEIIFRWFFTAALFPFFGWWALLWVPALNMIWHLPVYINMAGGHLADLKGIAKPVLLPATVSAFMLTAAVLVSHNLLGVVLAHAVGDWFGSVLRHQTRKAA